MADPQSLLSGTTQLWLFYILLMGASYYIGVKLQNIYKQRGK